MELKNYLILILSLILGFATYCHSSFRVINGKNIPVSMAPYIAALIKEPAQGHFCGGTIISLRVIASAAHCLDEGHPKKVRVGSRDDRNGGQLIDVLTAIAHSKYKSYHDVDATYDYGVVILKTPVKLSIDVMVAKLARRTRPDGTILTLSGWGDGQFLQQAIIPKYNQTVCLANYAYIPIPMDPNVSFCAGFPNASQTACFGDSGGPLIYGRNTLYGITSWGDDDCAVKDYPAVYARVSTMASWFQAFMDQYK